MLDILAILGRGTYLVPQNDGTLRWKTTALLETCDSDGAHLPVRIPVDDDDPRCLIGGGNANVISGVKLFKKHGPRIVVFAYGTRSKYLRTINGPPEGAVMKDEFIKRLKDDGCIIPAEIELYGGVPDEKLPGLPSNTLRELQNILNLAIEREMEDIGIVTIGVHMKRVRVFIDTLFKEKKYSEYPLVVKFFKSEEILLEQSSRYARHVRNMISSQAFDRNMKREDRGVQAFLNGTYQVPIDQDHSKP
ncbi:hypothetical protein HZC21_03420 [Candidatus Peregrinibacteria bacterium]|nr:hypothetical protein [Candidatus Peregrinibacteria bacterium]MBI5733009.1 hypothetical protein [Candidatus Jorgensenbacteria bacterium]